jgi:hypothetical protein
LLSVAAVVGPASFNLFSTPSFQKRKGGFFVSLKQNRINRIKNHIMKLQNLFDQVVAFAKECGMEQKTSANPKGNTIVRDNATGKQNNQEDFLKGAYFGFIRDEE